MARIGPVICTALGNIRHPAPKVTEQMENAAPRREPALIGANQREQQERVGVSMSLESSVSEVVG